LWSDWRSGVEREKERRYENGKGRNRRVFRFGFGKNI